MIKIKNFKTFKISIPKGLSRKFYPTSEKKSGLKLSTLDIQITSKRD